MLGRYASVSRVGSEHVWKLAHFFHHLQSLALLSLRGVSVIARLPLQNPAQYLLVFGNYLLSLLLSQLLIQASFDRW